MNEVSSSLPAKVLIALVFCLAGILPAQVHIREKVAITPKASVQTSSTSAASVQLTTELSLSGSTQPTRPPFISVRNITCGTENASNGAPVTVTALAGGYNITAGLARRESSTGD